MDYRSFGLMVLLATCSSGGDDRDSFTGTNVTVQMTDGPATSSTGEATSSTAKEYVRLFRPRVRGRGGVAAGEARVVPADHARAMRPHRDHLSESVTSVVSGYMNSTSSGGSFSPKSASKISHQPASDGSQVQPGVPHSADLP